MGTADDPSGPYGSSSHSSCEEGRNRSGLVTSLAVRELCRVSGADAVARVRAARGGMLANRTFAAALAGLPAPGC